MTELQSQIQIVAVKHESQFCHDLQPHATDLLLKCVTTSHKNPIIHRFELCFNDNEFSDVRKIIIKYKFNRTKNT